MFQNLANEIVQKYKDVKVNKNDNDNSNARITSKIFQNTFIYVIAFLVSMTSIKGSITPFALAFFIACCNTSIPAGLVLVVTIIGNFIGFGLNSTLVYILNVLVFIISILIFKPIIQDDRNEMTRLGKNVIISTVIIELVRCWITKNLVVYDILVSLLNIVLTYVFYKIFVNSITVVKNFNANKAFSIEEVIGATILITIAIAPLNQLKIFGMSITIIVAIFMVLLLNLRNGILVGGTTGTAVGLTLGILGICTPMQVLAFAVAGLIAGLLSKLGKVATICGFIAGVAMIAYISTGFSVVLISAPEIVVASVLFLFVPKYSGINIREMYDDVKLLEWNVNNRLADSHDAKDKLNNISGVVSEMAKALGVEDATLVADEIDNINNSKVTFVEDLLNNIEKFPNNLLYDDLSNLESGIIEDIYMILVEKSEMTKDDLMSLFEKRNNYIVGIDDNIVVKNDIDQIVRVINRTYRINEMAFSWKTKFSDSKKAISKQLDGVSKAINEIAEDITKEKKEKSNYEEKEKEIIELLNQKFIDVNDIKIKKFGSGKFVIDLYFKDTLIAKEKDKIKCIENILSKVCDEKISLQKDTSNIDANDYMQRYTSEDRFNLQLGYSKTTKTGNTVSGDSSLQIKLEDDKCLMILSDGMGSGIEARKSSQIVVKMLKKLLLAGFEKDDSLELINSTIKLTTEEVYATIDTAIFDLYNGNVEFIKNGCCKTYIKNKQNIDFVESNALPLGILNNVEVSVFDRDVSDGDIYVMCSDGVIDSKEEEHGDKWFVKLLKNISTNNVQKMADILLNEAIDNNYGICKDDMSVIVVKVSKKQKNK